MTEINEKEPIMITTDSVCDLPGEMIKELSIKVCPYYVRTGRGKFLDGYELDPDELLDRMEKKDDVVSSEAPSVSDYEAFFRGAAKRGEKSFISPWTGIPAMAMRMRWRLLKKHPMCLSLTPARYPAGWDLWS